MQYRLADQGLVFSTRDRGARVLADVRTKIGNAPMESVTIDFAGVRSVSYSFIDEFIGELMQSAAASAPKLVNVPTSAARTIKRSLRRRGVDTVGIIEDELQPA